MKLRWFGLGVVLAALVTPAATLTLVRAVEPPSAVGIQLVSFTPYAIPLYLVTLLLLFVPLLRRVGGVALRVLAGLVVIALVVHVWWARQPFIGGESAAAEQASGFAVMTANLRRGEADADAVVRAAIEYDVDVLVVEELTDELLARMEAAGLGSVLPARAGNPTGGSDDTMVFSRLPITRSEVLPLALGGRQMRIETAQGPLTLIAVHVRRPSYDGAAGWRTDNEAVRRAVSSVVGAVVVAGDFNSTLDHEPMRLLEDDGLTDAVVAAQSGWQPTWPSDGRLGHFGIAVPPMIQIDHVLVEHVFVHSTRTLEIEGTDHRAVVARLSLEG